MTIRIAYVIPTLTHGGAERQLYYLLRGLDHLSFDLSVCCLRMGGALEARVLELGVPVHHFDRTHKADFRAVAKLAMWLLQQSPDIVHTWLPTANLWGRIAGILAGRPRLIASERSVDIWKSTPRRALDRILARPTAAVTVNSEAVREFYFKTVGIPSEKLTTIHNGLDLAHIAHMRDSGTDWKRRLISELSFPDDATIVGTVARISKAKCLENFVKVAGVVLGKLPLTRFVIVGGAVHTDEQAYLENISRQISGDGLDGKVVITGFRDDPVPYLLGMDLFLQTSIREGLPNAVMEAMGCALPVVATDVGGTRELLEDDVSGYLTRPGDVRALAEKVAELLSHRDQRESKGRVAAAHMERSFGIDRMIEATAGLYRRVLQSDLPAPS